ncbi:MAG: hypothetical protein JOZ55_00345, partial [Alphaproteobacteria bacterium]|nr:hypothetical protein [Alphaproteobacteria bacterium]
MADTPPLSSAAQNNERQIFELQSTQGPLAPLEGSPPPAPEWFAEAVETAPEDRFVTVEGARVHYLRWGDREKPGLLLVHGNAAHAHWWDFIAPYLAR